MHDACLRFIRRATIPTNVKLFGDRWMLAGDAAGFIDPVFSSGVFLAVMSAEKAADTLQAGLGNAALKTRPFKDYPRRVNKVLDIYLNFRGPWERRGGVWGGF